MGELVLRPGCGAREIKLWSPCEETWAPTTMWGSLSSGWGVGRHAPGAVPPNESLRHAQRGGELREATHMVVEQRIYPDLDWG
jgi:hypothetical protein